MLKFRPQRLLCAAATRMAGRVGVFAGAAPPRLGPRLPPPWAAVAALLGRVGPPPMWRAFTSAAADPPGHNAAPSPPPVPAPPYTPPRDIYVQLATQEGEFESAECEVVSIASLLQSTRKHLLSKLHRADWRPRTTGMRVYVLRRVAGAEPTPLEEHDVVELPVDVPLAQLLADPAHGTLNPHGKVFLLVGARGIHMRADTLLRGQIVTGNRLLTPPQTRPGWYSTGLPERPEPLPPMAYDAELAQWVAVHPKQGPLYLDDAAKTTADAFLQQAGTVVDPAALFIAGPVKSGKSLWVREGLPGLLLARAARDPAAVGARVCAC
jgi:hypothetical protein